MFGRFGRMAAGGASMAQLAMSLSQRVHHLLGLLVDGEEAHVLCEF